MFQFSVCLVSCENHTNKMYKIEIPKTIHQLIGIFHRFGMWSDKNVTSFGEHCRKIFYFIYFLSFILSIAIGALTTKDNDECVFLTVVTIVGGVQVYRAWIILWDKNELLSLLHQIGNQSTDDREEFIRINNKLSVLMKFVRYFLISMAIVSSFGVIVFPITNERHLILNIAFPFDRNNSEIAFWMAYVFIGSSCYFGITVAILTTIIWYLMLSVSFQYKILGSQLIEMGISMKTDGLKVSLAAHQKLFFKDFIVAIKTYDKIDGYILLDVGVAIFNLI